MYLQMLVMDEDRSHHDDRIGLAALSLADLQLGPGFHAHALSVPIQRRKGNPKVYALGFIAALWPTVGLPHAGRVCVSVRVLGPTAAAGAGRPYTLGPSAWAQHFSPLWGSLTAGRSAPHPLAPPTLLAGLRDSVAAPFDPRLRAASAHRRLRPSVFVANALQLPGPLPASLALHFVGYQPWMAWMFEATGVRGALLNRLLHKQHRHVYSRDRHTRCGLVLPNLLPNAAEPAPAGPAPQAPSEPALVVPAPETSSPPSADADAAAIAHGRALAAQFLRMCSHGRGGRICTFVLTLDGLLRWTETGPQFAVDLLSKHTMHSDVAQDVAFAGEFFVRRLGGAGEVDGAEEGDGVDDTSNMEAVVSTDNNGVDDMDDIAERLVSFDHEDRPTSSASRSHTRSSSASSRPTLCPSSEYDGGPDAESDPAAYELVIDNASGTYRPPCALLTELAAFLAAPHRLGALGAITALDVADPTLAALKAARVALRLRQKRVKRDGARSRSTASVRPSS
jgi:hypothetical protein